MIKRLVLGLLLGLLVVFSSCFASEVMVWEGTGEFINQNGDILTARHVLHNGDTLNVNYKGKMYKASIVAEDVENDLAVIHINVQNDYAFKIADEASKVGEEAIIIGYPATTDKLTVTSGRIIEVDDYSYIQNVDEYIVCGGNSGGPTVNKKGQLIGIIDRSVTNRKDLCGNIALATPLFNIRNFILVNKIQAIPSLNVSINPDQILGGAVKKDGVVQIINFNLKDLTK